MRTCRPLRTLRAARLFGPWPEVRPGRSRYVPSGADLQLAEMPSSRSRTTDA
jgi:hypothetical protein